MKNHQEVMGRTMVGGWGIAAMGGGTMNIRGVEKGVEGDKSCRKGCFKAILCFSIVTPQMLLSLGVQWGLEAGGWLAEVPYSCSPYS